MPTTQKKAANTPAAQTQTINININDISQADVALRKIKTAEVQLEEITNDLNKQQLANLGAVSKQVVKLLQTIAEQGNAVNDYSKANKGFLFPEKKKTFALPHGKLKFSESSASTRMLISEKTLGFLQKLGMEDAIRTFEPEVNLQALNIYDDATLSRVRAKREETPKAQSYSYETIKIDPKTEIN